MRPLNCLQSLLGKAGWWGFGCDDGREISFTIPAPLSKGNRKNKEKAVDKGSRVREKGKSSCSPGKEGAWLHFLQGSLLPSKGWGRAVNHGCTSGLRVLDQVPGLTPALGVGSSPVLGRDSLEVTFPQKPSGSKKALHPRLVGGDHSLLPSYLCQPTALQPPLAGGEWWKLRFPTAVVAWLSPSCS